MKGFIRKQEEQLALRLLTWRYKKNNLPLPGISELQMHSEKLVDEAHRIGKERGKNVISIIKELIEDIKNKKKD